MPPGFVNILFMGAFIVVALIVAVAVLSGWVRRRRDQQAERRLAAIRREFGLRREWLEARFVTKASQTGKPRGLAWSNVDFDNPVEFARDRTTGNLRALVAIEIKFEAIEGGGMEQVEAVGNVKAATAVFQFDGEQWDTQGRAIFNLNPTEAILHYQHELEKLSLS